jgi:hypothetical protein
VLHWLGYIGMFVVAFILVALVTGFVGSLLVGSLLWQDAMGTPFVALRFGVDAALSAGLVWLVTRSWRPSAERATTGGTAAVKPVVLATFGPPQAAPTRNRQVIATFRQTPGWSGQRIFRRGDSFMIEGHGPFSAADVMRYDEQGQLRWVNDGMRASVGSMACRPQGRASSAAGAAPPERKPPEAHAPKATSAGEAKTPRAAVASGSAASRPGTASGLSKGTDALTAPLEAAQPARGPVIIATFRPMTHWPGRAITYEGGQIFIEGRGPVTANAIMYYDRCGNLTWAHAGLRKRVEALATPAGPPSTPTPAAVASAQDPLLKELPAETTPHAATLAPADESSEGSDPARMDPISLIRSLGQLRDEGFLSDEAFEAKKAEILGRL